jgi:hypothetical protein
MPWMSALAYPFSVYTVQSQWFLSVTPKVGIGNAQRYIMIKAILNDTLVGYLHHLNEGKPHLVD